MSSSVAGITISGAKAIDATAAVGAMVPLSKALLSPAAGAVVAELTLLAAVLLRGVLRAVARGQAPDVLAVALPLHRVLDRVRALRIGGAPAVLEVVHAAVAHVRIADAAEIDPGVRVLVAEMRRERGIWP